MNGIGQSKPNAYGAQAYGNEDGVRAASNQYEDQMIGGDHEYSGHSMAHFPGMANMMGMGYQTRSMMSNTGNRVPRVVEYEHYRHVVNEEDSEMNDESYNGHGEEDYERGGGGGVQTRSQHQNNNGVDETEEAIMRQILEQSKREK